MKKLLIALLVLSLIASAAPAFATFEAIQRGSKGERVVEVQQYLIEEGFLTGKADGDFGKGTERAVIAFQEANGIEATGIIDENTYDILSGNIPPEQLIEIDPDRVDRNTLVAGENHFVCLLEDGTVFSTTDGEVNYYNGQCDVTEWKDIISVSAGFNFTVGLRSNGTVIGTGANASNQYGGIKKWTGIIDVACGAGNTLGLKMDGTVVATGNNDNKQCNVSGWTDIVNVEAGGWHTLGLKSDGTVVATGDNDYGQCNVSGWTDIVDIAANYWASFGLKADGTVVYAGGHDSQDRAKLDAVKRWANIVAIKAVDSTDVFGIKADDTIVDTNGRVSQNTSGSDIAFCRWHNTAVILLPDGSVDCWKIKLGNIKLQQPSVYESAVSEASTEPQDTGIWTVQAFVDEFNLPTNDYYIVNSAPFTGTFSNSATTNSDLKAYLYCSKYKNYDMLQVRLLEYGQVRVNNPYSKTRYYDVAVMDCDGSKAYTEGSMYSNSYDVNITDEQPILDALKKGGIVRLAITDRENSLTKYVITIEDATGFSAAYFDYWNK